MKKILLYCLPALLFFASCAEDDAADPTIDDREKFLGEWNCTETIGTNSMTFKIYITSYGESDSMRLSNFSNYGNTAVALGLSTGNSIVIPNQPIGVTNIVVQGSGTYSSTGGNEKINLAYSTDGQSATAVCSR